MKRFPTNQKNNFHNVILRYKVKNFESNNPESYLNKISEWEKERVYNDWKQKFKKFKLQINPVFQFYNSITGEESHNSLLYKCTSSFNIMIISKNISIILNQNSHQ